MIRPELIRECSACVVPRSAQKEASVTIGSLCDIVPLADIERIIARGNDDLQEVIAQTVDGIDIVALPEQLIGLCRPRIAEQGDCEIKTVEIGKGIGGKSEQRCRVSGREEDRPGDFIVHGQCTETGVRTAESECVGVGDSWCGDPYNRHRQRNDSKRGNNNPWVTHTKESLHRRQVWVLNPAMQRKYARAMLREH